MSAADSEAAVDRLAGRLMLMTPVDQARYLFLAFGILAYHAPEVAAFILDRADERVTS